LYQIYEPTLKIAGTSYRAFKNFTKENYDSFSRLKWKWVNSAIACINLEEEIKIENPRVE
jgi:hypothetical protein